jgi:hypothetical protein
METVSRLGTERREGEPTAGHAPRPWEPRAVSALEDTLALGVGNLRDGDPFTIEFPNAKVKTRRDDTQAY